MRILVLGGDGFCGWPTALHLSAAGNDVRILDNGSRREIDRDMRTNSLTPIASMTDRVAAWNAVSSQAIGFRHLDLGQYTMLLAELNRYKPDAIVHLAEQRAAPYSMRDPSTKRYTVANNILATHNVLCAVVESGIDTHLVHLGSTGVYGYGAFPMTLPEGYLTVSFPDAEGQMRETEILHPASAGSVYHMTKCMDEQMFQFYAANDGLRITDLHQGIVWGTQTEETQRDDRLVNRFDYDGDYGTVLNRFLMQAAVGCPLTVYGSGGQTRAFIHIQDTVKCIRLAIENPHEGGRPRILNQMAEVRQVEDLANIVSRQTGAQIEHLPNPRVEAAENDLSMANDGLRNLGWEPIKLESGLMREVTGVAERYADRCRMDTIHPTAVWCGKNTSQIRGQHDGH
jgi:UDP-sulfoquinovose synthase